MSIYIGIYILLAASLFLVRSKRDQQLLFYFWIFFLVVFVGSRLDTGCDFSSYVNRFKYFDVSTSVRKIVADAEPGFQLFTYLVKSNGLNIFWFNTFCAMCFFVFVKIFVSWHPSPILLLTIMFPILIVQLSMSGVRQALAVGFFMLAMVSFVKGSRLLVGIYILIGATFHQSVIVFLPLAVMVGKNISSVKVLAGLSIVGPISTFFLLDRLSVYNDRYIEQIYGAQESSGALLRLGLMLLTFIIFELKKGEVKNLFPQFYPLIRLFSLIAFALIPVAAISTVAIHRFSFYILPVQLFTLGLLPYAFSETKRMLHKYQLSVIGLYGLYIVVWFSFSRHADVCYSPYNSYLF